MLYEFVGEARKKGIRDVVFESVKQPQTRHLNISERAKLPAAYMDLADLAKAAVDNDRKVVEGEAKVDENEGETGVGTGLQPALASLSVYNPRRTSGAGARRPFVRGPTRRSLRRVADVPDVPVGVVEDVTTTPQRREDVPIETVDLSLVGESTPTVN